MSNELKWAGFCPAELYLPKECDWQKWSVIASDLYFAEPDYWREVAEFVGDAPSTWRVMLPEALYSDGRTMEHAQEIERNWKEYIQQDLFERYPDALVYVERWRRDGKLCRGLVGAIDLEQYDYAGVSEGLIRATEGIVASRLPQRMMVRRVSEMEISHARLLIDDPEQVIIEHLTAETEQMKKLYDFDLMMNSGHITGYLLTEEQKAEVCAMLWELANKERYEKKYDAHRGGIMLYAVGDGNHHLATAKQYYEELKASDPDADWSKHPARYALAAVENLWEDAVELKAVHRVVCDVDLDNMREELIHYYAGTHYGRGEGQTFTCVWSEGEEEVTIPEPLSEMVVESLQGFVDYYLMLQKGECGYVDYIVNEEEAREMGKEPNCVALLMEPLDKRKLFRTVIHDGALPRKSFCIGEPQDRRFYVEARRIKD